MNSLLLMPPLLSDRQGAARNDPVPFAHTTVAAAA